MNKIRFVKVDIARDWVHASRNRREVEAVCELGWDATVMIPQDGIADEPKDYQIIKCPVKTYRNIPLRLKHFLWGISWAKQVAALKPDVISGRDIKGADIALLSNLFRKDGKKAKIVYDAHEYELGLVDKNNRIRYLSKKMAEGFVLRHSVFSVMVNDSIADEVQRIYRIKKRPVVVRSTPPCWDVNEDECKAVKNNLRKELGVKDNTFLIMFHGVVAPYCGLETLIEQVSRNDHIAGVILGNGEQDYIDRLKLLIEEKNVTNRICFHEAVEVNELWKYVGAADINLILEKNICNSYYYMLPNKFLSSIQSLCPVIGSDFPEIRKIVNRYDIGKLCDPEDMDEIAASIESMRIDQSLYARYKRNLLKAKSELCWEKEKEVLQNAYREII